MVDILHRIGVKASQDAVYGALATPEGLAGWWTNDTSGDSAPGGVLAFRFGDLGGFDMKVVEARTSEHVLGRPSTCSGK